MKRKRKPPDDLPHVLLLYRDFIPSVLLCGHAQLKQLNLMGKIQYRYGKPLFISLRDLQWADTVIAVRLDNPYEEKLLAHAKRAGKQILYAIDDDLLHVPDCSASKAHYSQSDISESIKKIAAQSDALLSPSPRILSLYCRTGQPGFLIEEPAIMPVPYRPHETEHITIGFAGSIDRTKDLEILLSKALLWIHEKYPETVHFEFFGVKPAFAEELNATVIPYCDSYMTYRDILNKRSWDIGLAPMPESAFHSCKHYNKFSEYSAAGIVGVFSQVEPYTRIPYEGAVFCANTEDCWQNVLSSLIDDREHLEQLRQQVARVAMDELSIEKVVQKLDTNLIHLLMYRSKRLHIDGVYFLRFQYYVKRIISFFTISR